jgi:hypothetical protein
MPPVVFSVPSGMDYLKTDCGAIGHGLRTSRLRIWTKLSSDDCQAKVKGVGYLVGHGKERATMMSTASSQTRKLHLVKYDPDDTGEYKKTDDGKRKATLIDGPASFLLS